MRYIIPILVIVLLGAWYIYSKHNRTELPAAAYALTNQQIVDQANATNFGLKITAGDSFGLCSATLIDSEKYYLLTAWHCLETNHDKNGQPIKPYTLTTEGQAGQVDLSDEGKFEGKHLYKFKVIASDEDLDLALVQLTDSEDGHYPIVKAVKVACTNPHRLDPIYAVGNPYGEFGVISKGNVVKVELSDKLHVVYYSATTGSGMSGGAIINERGRIIAVISQQLTENKTLGIGSGLQNIMQFIVAANINNHLNTSGLACAD